MNKTFVLLLVGLAGASCGRTTVTPPPAVRATAPDVVRLTPQAQRNAGIVIADAQLVMRGDRTEAPGLVALDEGRTARIGSFVQGIILETAVQVGDRVGAGQVLATMHSTIVHDTWAAYRKAVAERRRAEHELAFAAQAHERAKRLYADAALSLQELQRAETNRIDAAELLDMAQTEVRRAEEELEHLGITNGEDPTGESGEQIPVKTPVRGLVLERLVTAGTTVTPGTPLFVVSDLSALWVLAEVDESLLSRIVVGRPVEVRVAAYPDEQFHGTVTLIGDTVNPKTRRVTVRCALPNADGRLKPEMFATVVLEQKDARRAVVVPSEAVQSIDGKPTVFVSEPDNSFRAQQITRGTEADGQIEVVSGLQAGNRVVVTGSFVLKSELLRSSSAGE
jgi:cobalt-zinc-cadmium efflux system membrane fusion protein